MNALFRYRDEVHNINNSSCPLRFNASLYIERNALLLGHAQSEVEGLMDEAATCYINATNETGDLASAVLLERAGYCYLKAYPNPSVRKFAFHLILAGHRYGKAGQRR